MNPSGHSGDNGKKMRPQQSTHNSLEVEGERKQVININKTVCRLLSTAYCVVVHPSPQWVVGSFDCLSVILSLGIHLITSHNTVHVH